MSEFDRSLYVACALNGSPESFRQDVEEVKKTLEVEHNINVLHFRGLGDFTAQDVYDYDINMVRRCSAFLGIYGHMSDGRGMETQEAFNRQIPMLGVATHDDLVSKMVLGGYERHNQPFIRVNDLKLEIPQLVVKQFVEIDRVL